MYRKEAREDMAKGDTLYLAGGLLILNPELGALARKYGFRYMGICTGSPEGQRFYNDEMIKHLEKRNRENWWDRFLAEKAKLKDNWLKSLPKNEKK